MRRTGESEMRILLQIINDFVINSKSGRCSPPTDGTIVPSVGAVYRLLCTPAGLPHQPARRSSAQNTETATRTSHMPSAWRTPPHSESHQEAQEKQKQTDVCLLADQYCISQLYRSNE